MTNEEVIVNKIDELCNSTILFLEKERKLSPAGKFQACILTTVSIILIIDTNQGKSELYGEKMKKILSLIEPKLIRRFKLYSQEYINSNYKVENLNNEFLNKLMKASNDMLVERDEQFIKNAIIIGVSQFWKECKDYQFGFERYNSGQGKAIFPELMFISLYVHPFFNSVVENQNKPRMCALIDNEVNSSELEYFDFMLIPAKLMDFLVSKLNSDENFINNMKRAPKNNTQSKSNNSGCMLLFSVIIILSVFSFLV